MYLVPSHQINKSPGKFMKVLTHDDVLRVPTVKSYESTLLTEPAFPHTPSSGQMLMKSKICLNLIAAFFSFFFI